jgi:hypothetical protein
MSEPKRVTAAIVISLFAGILIILASIYVRWLYGVGGWLYGWMMTGIGGMLGYSSGMWLVGLATGILVLISSIMLKIRPGEGERGLRMCCRWWGSLILIFSIASLFGAATGGFFVGAILGIIGGGLALSHGIINEPN